MERKHVEEWAKAHGPPISEQEVGSRTTYIKQDGRVVPRQDGNALLVDAYNCLRRDNEKLQDDLERVERELCDARRSRSPTMLSANDAESEMRLQQAEDEKRSLQGQVSKLEVQNQHVAKSVREVRHGLCDACTTCFPDASAKHSICHTPGTEHLRQAQDELSELMKVKDRLLMMLATISSEHTSTRSTADRSAAEHDRLVATHRGEIQQLRDKQAGADEEVRQLRREAKEAKDALALRDGAAERERKEREGAAAKMSADVETAERRRRECEAALAGAEMRLREAESRRIQMLDAAAKASELAARHCSTACAKWVERDEQVEELRRQLAAPSPAVRASALVNAPPPQRPAYRTQSPTPPMRGRSGGTRQSAGHPRPKYRAAGQSPTRPGRPTVGASPTAPARGEMFGDPPRAGAKVRSSTAAVPGGDRAARRGSGGSAGDIAAYGRVLSHGHSTSSGFQPPPPERRSISPKRRAAAKAPSVRPGGGHRPRPGRPSADNASRRTAGH